MKKLLIIALLFGGCESFGVFKNKDDFTQEQDAIQEQDTNQEKNGVCAIKDDDGYTCYSGVNEYYCLSFNYSSNPTSVVSEWFYMTCEEFCETTFVLGVDEDECVIDSTGNP